MEMRLSLNQSYCGYGRRASKHSSPVTPCTYIVRFLKETASDTNAFGSRP